MVPFSGRSLVYDVSTKYINAQVFLTIQKRFPRGKYVTSSESTDGDTYKNRILRVSAKLVWTRAFFIAATMPLSMANLY